MNIQNIPNNETDDFKKFILNNLSTVKYAPIGTPAPGTSWYDNKTTTEEGRYDPNNHTIYQKQYSPFIDFHEKSHSSTRGRKGLPFRADPIKMNPEKIEILKGYPYYKDFSDNGRTLPTEQKARKDVIAYYMKKNNLWDPINTNFGKKEYDILRKKHRELKTIHQDKLSTLSESELKNDPWMIENFGVIGEMDDLIFPYDENETIRIFNDIVLNKPSNKYKNFLQVAKKGGQATLDKFYKNLFQNVNKRVGQDEDASFGKRALGAIETVVEDPLNALNFLFTKKQKLSNPWENPYGVDFISDRQGNVKKTWAPKYGAVDNSTTTEETTRPPIYTDDKKKVQAYNDRLSLYNNEKKIYESETGLSYDKLLKFPSSNIDAPRYGYTYSNKPLYGYKKPVQPYILQEQPQLKMVGHEIDRSSSFPIPNIIAKSPTLLQQKQGDYVLRFQEYDEEGNPINREVFSNDRKQLDDMMNFLSQQGRKYNNISTQGNYNSVPYKKGGLIRRKDGSYSRRGLWDNIRANAGSGKQPTKEMLEQERKIRKNN
jgi:hypothetical protein